MTGYAVLSNHLSISNRTSTSRITRYFRLSRITLHTLIGVLIAAVIFPMSNKPSQLRLIRWWCQQLLQALNVRVLVYGKTPPEYKTARNNMLVANHVSWLDIHAINSILPVRFIAKSDIKSWPVFGYLAKKSQVLFIERGKRQHAPRIVDITTRSLKAGDNVCLFPEGTTTDGTRIMPFKGSVMQSALHAESTIWPIALRYPSLDGSINTELAYAGETTLVQSILSVLRQQNPVIELHFLASISSAQLTKTANRRELTGHIHGMLKEKLKL